MNSINQSLDFTTIIDSQINKCIEQLKEYIQQYSLLPVLEKSFINDNFLYEKEDGSVNDDCKLSLYIGDLFLTYQKNQNLELPTTEQIENIFNLLLELVRLSMTKEMLENKTDVSTVDFKTLFKYTERSFYIPIMTEICQDLIKEKWQQCFFSITSFCLQDIFTFNFVYKSLLYERFEQNVEKLFAFSFEDLFLRFKEVDNSITEERLQNFINYFTCNESKNFAFLLSENNPLKHKPIIQVNEQIICCDSLILIKDIFFIVEEVFKKDEKLFTEYGKDKGINFENKVKNIFQHFFPDAFFYSGLEYVTEDKKEHEADLIIDTGNYLVIAESKGRSFQENAKKGNFGSYKRSINNTIEKAHEQCKTTYEYLLSKDSVSFKKNGEEYSFSRNTYMDIYLITIELDNLDSITSDIHKTVEVFETNPIVTFSLYDLIVFQDILERGSIFLNYLEQRRGTIKQKKTTASTELDYLSYYINTGLFFDKQKEIIQDDFSELTIGNYSDEIDKYYFGETSVKPHYKISPEAKSFFQLLAKCNPKLGFTIEKEFMTADSEIQNSILVGIDRLKGQAQDSYKSSVFSFVLESTKMGISIICFKNKNIIPNASYFRSYIHEKQKQCSVNNWFLIIYSLEPYSIHTIICER